MVNLSESIFGIIKRERINNMHNLYMCFKYADVYAKKCETCNPLFKHKIWPSN